MTINELIEVAHSDAKAAGWWDEERNTGELLMLIVSECGEALEAHRKGMVNHISNTPLDHIGVAGMSIVMDQNTWVDEFRSKLKDHMADELSDIVIRIADLFGDTDYRTELFLRTFRFERDDHIEVIYDNMGENLLHVVKLVCHDGPVYLDAALRYVFGIAKAHNIDLWRHIELKLEYNRTRPKRHGKAY